MNQDVQAVKDFKKAVTAAKNRREMFWRSQAPELAFAFDEALHKFKNSVNDPQTGVEALLDFYKRDAQIFERCDDSYGNVGDVFCITAAQMLVDFAKHCDNKEEIARQLVDLQADSHYGVRDCLIDKVSCFLDKLGIEKLIRVIEEKIPPEADIVDQRKWLLMIESLARQINDGALFERTRIRNWQGLNARAYIDIAKVYFDSGDAQIAYDRLQKATGGLGSDSCDYIVLYKEVCRALGKTDEADIAAWKIFRGSRSKDSLDELLAQIGQNKRAEVIEGEKN